MKTPHEMKAKGLTLNIRSAARQVRRTDPTKLTCTPQQLDACLGALGCHVDARGNFNLLDLLRAIRVNVEPVGVPRTDEAVAAEKRKARAIVRGWSGLLAGTR